MKTTPYKKNFARKRRRGSFWLGYIVYLVALIALISVGLIYFHHYMDAYETSQPEHTVEQLLREKDSAWWSKLITESDQAGATEFEQTDAIIKLLKLDDLSDATFSYKKRVGEYTTDAPVYTITADQTAIARVVLTAEKKDTFGFPCWTVSSVSAALGDASNALGAVTIAVPSDAAVTVNGIPLSEQYLHTARAEYDGTGPLETGCDTVPYRKVYTITGLFNQPTIEVVSPDGAKLSPTETESGIYTYGAAPAYTVKAEIVVPEDAVVKINGITLTDTYRTDETLPYAFLEGASGYTGPARSRIRYRAEGLCVSPVVEAFSADGTALPAERAEDGVYVFDFPASARTESAYAGRVEDFVRAYIAFTAQGSRDTEQNFTALADSYLLPGSHAYAYLRSFVSSVKWNNPYNVTYNTLSLTDFIPYGEDCFSCYAAFDVTFTTWGAENRYTGKFRLLFVRADDEWRVAEMTVQA